MRSRLEWFGAMFVFPFVRVLSGFIHPLCQTAKKE